MLKGIDETLSSKLDFVCFKVCVHISPCSCYGDRHDGVVVAPSFPLSLFLSLFNPGIRPPQLKGGTLITPSPFLEETADF